LKYITLKALSYGSHCVTCKLHRTCLRGWRKKHEWEQL